MSNWDQRQMPWLEVSTPTIKQFNVDLVAQSVPDILQVLLRI
jgi:hypothetical protein